MIRSPRTNFTTGPHREAMERIATSDAFRVACDTSLLIMLEEFPNPLDPSAQPQLAGARRVLNILKTIYELEEPRKDIKPPSLNYDIDHRRP